MIVLDAGVLIGLLESTDAHHAAAGQVFAQIRGPLMIHTLTMAEVLAGPARTGHEREVREDLIDIGVRVADLGVDEAVLVARLRATHRLKMPDTCVLATAVHLGAPLVTFDTKLADVARGLGLLHLA